MDDMFEPDDVRSETLKLMEEIKKDGTIDADLEHRMGKNYYELRTMAAVKFKALVDEGNGLVPLALPFLGQDCNQMLTQKFMNRIKDDYDNLVDLLVTLYLLRGLEVLGKVDKPFCLEVQDATEQRD